MCFYIEQIKEMHKKKNFLFENCNMWENCSVSKGKESLTLYLLNSWSRIEDDINVLNCHDLKIQQSFS